MNRKETSHSDEIMVKNFLTRHKLEPRDNIWFTQRVSNKLPMRTSVACKVIMILTTLIAIVVCGALLYVIGNHNIPQEENNLSPSLLSIYIAMMSSVILITLQVIRLIKTYF